MSFADTNIKMPVLFVGHGSPMNAIEENKFSLEWRKISEKLPKPQAILAISAHWLTKGTAVTAMDKPKTIHDFGGFPQALFDVEYPANGSPELANLIKDNIKSTDVILDKHEWGLDHGTWSVLRQMYPDADIPIIQLSIDYYKPASFHYKLAKELSFLRKKGVLIFSSGNIVHNLRMIDFNNPNSGYDWAKNFDQFAKEKIENNDHQALIDYEKFGRDAVLSVPTPEHYYPLLYILGLKDNDDKLSFFNDDLNMGSLSMRSVLFE